MSKPVAARGANFPCPSSTPSSTADMGGWGPGFAWEYGGVGSVSQCAPFFALYSGMSLGEYPVGWVGMVSRLMCSPCPRQPLSIFGIQFDMPRRRQGYSGAYFS